MTEVIKPIPSRIKSGVVGGYVTGAADIIDDEKNMSQAAVNAAVDAEIGSDDTEGTIKGRIADLEEAVGPGGSVEEQIQAAIGELDSTKSQTAGTDGLALSVTEVDGVITGISGSIATNTYDSYGAASTVETNLLGDAGTNYNTLGKLEDAIQAETSTRETEIGTDSTSGTVKGRIKSLETLVGSTSVDSQIDTKINALDVTKSQTAGADGLALSIEEENGKIKSISGSIAANTYDAYGAASTTKTELLGDAASDYNTLGKLEDAIQTEATTRGNADTALDGRLDAVEEVIPSAATSTNQLADKEFVNSSISTSTATFRGTSATGLTETEFLTWANSLTKDANDYVFWNTADAAGTPQFKRYKYNGTAWVYEYTLNNSSFTADQWATINSLLTSSHKDKLDALPTNTELTTLFAGKEDVISDLATIRSGAAAGATAYQKPSTGIPSSDMTSAVQTSLGKADSAYQKPAAGIPSTDLTEGVQASLGKADTAIQSDDLATVATSGSYNDLVDKPSIPSGQVQADWNQTNTSEVDYIKNKPTIPTVPTNVSAFTNDAGYLTQHQDVSGKANKSEMGVSTSGDKTTITLKSGTSATVINAHQDLSGKQDTLVSGTNIKTINNNSILGSGNIDIQAGGTYTEGNGIDITNGEISVKAGSNLSFDANGNLNATDTTYSDVTTSASGLMSSSDKSKLDGIAAGAEVNVQSDWNATSGDAVILNKPTIPAAAANGTYTVKTLVGSTTTNVSDFTANQSSADDVTFVQGSNVTITPDATNRKITIAATDTTYSEATTSAAGLMSSDDKSKLNGIEAGAQKHIAPTADEVKSALGTGSGTSKYLREDGTWQTPEGGSATDINYDTTNKKITKTVNGVTSDVVTAAKIVEDGGGAFGISWFALETSSSPEFTVSNQWAAERYINHMGGYLFLVKNGNVYAAKLNPSNWSLFADGSTVTNAAKAATECMIHVPDCHYLGSGTTLQFGGMTPIENGHVFASPHWVGAYQMSTGGHSRAGVGSAHTNYMIGFWNNAQAIHADFGLANYQFHCLINAVYQARYGNLNSENFLSNGNSRSSESFDAFRDLAHGMADSLGDGTGCVSAVDSANITRYVTKLFGFEDLFGKLWEYRSGIRFYMSGGVRHAVVYDGNIVSNTAEGRDISGMISSANGEYITQMELGEYWDMLPKAVGGSNDTYYCDVCYARGTGETLCVGGEASGGLRNGLTTCINNDTFGSGAWNTFGARLAFYGEPEIVSGAELLSML